MYPRISGVRLPSAAPPTHQSNINTSTPSAPEPHLQAPRLAAIVTPHAPKPPPGAPHLRRACWVVHLESAWTGLTLKRREAREKDESTGMARGEGSVEERRGGNG